MARDEQLPREHKTVAICLYNWSKQVYNDMSRFRIKHRTHIVGMRSEKGE
jgi:hypothetical protein